MGPRTEAHSAAKLSDFRHPWTNLPIMFTCPRTGEEASLPLQLSNEFCASLSWLPAVNLAHGLPTGNHLSVFLVLTEPIPSHPPNPRVLSQSQNQYQTTTTTTLFKHPTAPPASTPSKASCSSFPIATWNRPHCFLFSYYPPCCHYPCLLAQSGFHNLPL